MSDSVGPIVPSKPIWPDHRHDEHRPGQQPHEQDEGKQPETEEPEHGDEVPDEEGHIDVYV